MVYYVVQVLMQKAQTVVNLRLNRTKWEHPFSQYSLHLISPPQTFQGRSIMVDSTPRDILDGSTLITTHTDPEKGVTLKSQPHIIVS